MSWTSGEVDSVCLPAFAPSTLLAPGIKSAGVRGQRLTKAQWKPNRNPRETQRTPSLKSVGLGLGGLNRPPTQENSLNHPQSFNLHGGQGPSLKSVGFGAGAGCPSKL